MEFQRGYPTLARRRYEPPPGRAFRACADAYCAPTSPNYCIPSFSTVKMRWTLLNAALLAIATISAASRLTPPVLPLVVRNPYLSTWLGNAREPPWEAWPMFYTGQTVGINGLGLKQIGSDPYRLAFL